MSLPSRPAFIVAVCFNEEFHDLVTDANNVKGIFLTKKAAEAHVQKYFIAELAGEAFEKEWNDVSLKLGNTYNCCIHRSKEDKERIDREFNEKQQAILQKHGFKDYQDYAKVSQVYVRIFETVIYEEAS